VPACLVTKEYYKRTHRGYFIGLILIAEGLEDLGELGTADLSALVGVTGVESLEYLIIRRHDCDLELLSTIDEELDANGAIADDAGWISRAFIRVIRRSRDAAEFA